MEEKENIPPVFLYKRYLRCGTGGIPKRTKSRMKRKLSQECRQLEKKRKESHTEGTPVSEQVTDTEILACPEERLLLKTNTNLKEGFDTVKEYLSRPTAQPHRTEEGMSRPSAGSEMYAQEEEPPEDNPNCEIEARVFTHNTYGQSENDAQSPCSAVMAETSSNAISSTDQNYLLLLALKTKHQLTNEALEDILKLLNHIGGDGTVPASKYYFEKYFSDCKGVIDIYLICETCEMLLGNKATSGNCSFCGEQWVASHNISKGQFFFYMPLKSQIKALLNDISVQKHLAFLKERSTTGNYSDIQDGTLYKKVLNGSPSNTLSVNFSCDGVPVFKSSQYSVWPVLCVLNELPPVERLKHVLMASLWFGSKKPDMNLYLQPFVNECQDLMQSGVDWENAVTQEKINSKVVCTVAICDSVARPLLQNMMQFNGLHGCGFCTDPGTNVPKGRGMTRAYPYKKDFVLRSCTETIEQAEHAFQNKKTVCGVKGPSILMCIPNFDIINGFIPDYMHCALLGVARQMMRLWVESKYHRYPFYLGTQVEHIDSRLLPIKPPSNISRIPRSVTQYKFWKAHEWFAWLVFYSVPVLKGILQEKYFLYWCLLVEGIAILTSQSISEEQLYHCERVFIHFVVLTETLYGTEHVSYNVHSTLHLVKSVRDWGPLWAHSDFLYESYNGHLLDMVKGTQAVPLQMCRKFLMEQSLKMFKEKLHNMPAEKLFLSFCCKQTPIQGADEVDNITVLGTPKRKKLERKYYLALHSVAEQVLPGLYFKQYDRIIVNGEIIHSEQYGKLKKRNSFTVSLRDGNFFKIETFAVVNLGNGEKCYAIGRYMTVIRNSFCNDDVSRITLSHIKRILSKFGHLVAVESCAIQRKCVHVHLPRESLNYVCEMPNNVECCK